METVRRRMMWRTISPNSEIASTICANGPLSSAKPIRSRPNRRRAGPKAAQRGHSFPREAKKPLAIDRRENDWETDTPALIYRLECFSPNELEQKVELTRDEYIRLKEHLVRVRGFIAQEAARAEGEQGRG
jgi:hypothetical protein